MNVIAEPGSLKPAVFVASSKGQPAKEREAKLEIESLAPLDGLKKGDAVDIPLLGNQRVAGLVNLVQEDEDGWRRIGGQLSGEEPGSFSLGSNGTTLVATVMLTKKGLAYEVSGQADQTIMSEKLLSAVVCAPIPRPVNEPEMIPNFDAPQEAPPLLSSRPTVAAVLYLDFDGETVTDPNWNSGNTIVAAASPLTNTQITEVWNRVKEDFWPFNIDVTTSLSRYTSAPVGMRMRCIITPTNTASPGAGGVAYLNSFDRAGSTFSSTIPCWVFNSSIVGVAEAISHELGHTFGLSHDGRTTPAEGYYEGHGTGAVGWAPIMGVGYYKSLVQWSKGEYTSANNAQDDVAIISNSANGFGYVADEAGNTLASAVVLDAPAGAFNQPGVITRSSDVDFYMINVPAGPVSISATPAALSPNLDILLELQNSAGTVVASSNPDAALNATINQSVAAGVYFLKISGTGRGMALETGYSNYGSIGEYTLSGTIPLHTGRMLWSKSDGAAALWSLDASDLWTGVSESYGPYAGWTANSFQRLSDGTGRLLWSHINGSAQIWSLNAGNVWTGASKSYGPYARWTASSYQRISDGTGRLLWYSTSGDAVIWYLDANDNWTGAIKAFGPYDGWKGTSYFRNADGTARLLWSHTSGSVQVWTLNASDNWTGASKSFGPFGGWTATSYQRNSDGTGRLLWSHINGTAQVWTLNASDNWTGSSKSYGPFADWTATSYFR